MTPDEMKIQHFHDGRPCYVTTDTEAELTGRFVPIPFTQIVAEWKALKQEAEAYANDVASHGYPAMECGAVHHWPEVGLRLVCEKPARHDGMHGSGPFVEYSTEWPESNSAPTQETDPE